MSNENALPHSLTPQVQERQGKSQTETLLLVLRTVLMGAAAIVVSLPLTTSFGWFVCGLGAAVGVLVGTKFGYSRVRQWVLVVGALLGLVMVQWLAEKSVMWELPTAILGGGGALELAEFFRWGMGAFFLFGLLRCSAHRFPAFGVLELILPLLASASLFSSHREGNIHRPQQLVDFAVERGQDPTWYLRMIGVVGAVFLAIGLLRLRRGVQIFGGIAFILLLMLGMLFLSHKMPKSTLISLKERFGKTGKEKKKAKGKRKRQRQGSKSKDKKKKKKNQKNKDKMKFQPPEQDKQNKRKPIAVVIFRNDYRPPSHIYYFRQRILSQFNGIRFVQSSRGDVDRERVLHFPIPNMQIKVRPSIALPASLKKREVSKEKPTISSKISVKKKPLSTKGLLALLKKEKKKKKGLHLERIETIVAMLGDSTNPFGLVSPRLFRGLPNPNSGIFLRSYMVVSRSWSGSVFPRFRATKDAHLPLLIKKFFPLLHHKVGEAWWSKDIWRYYTQPPTNPKYRELLEQILSLLKSEDLKAKKMARLYAIKYWLQKNLAYSMRIRSPKTSRDHVAHFLFESKIGYCVHFSHAAVYLARLAGIPARVAEGFAVPEKERGRSSSLLIRAGAAHAWPEIYLRKIGWVVFDIYPRRNLDTQRPQPPDPDKRKMLAQLARPKKIPPLKKDRMTAKTRKARWKWKRFSWWLSLPWHWLPLAFLLVLFSLKWWRQFSYLWAPKEKKMLFFYRCIEDRLSEQGIRREAGETLEHFAARFEETMPHLLLLLEQVSAIHFGSRLSVVVLSPEDQKALLKEYRSWVPWYKRLLRAFDPFSWAGHVLSRWRYFPPLWWLKWLAFWERVNDVLNRFLFFFRRAR